MKGDSLAWLLFWLGVGFAVCINLATGVLLSIVFITLQTRRDLQTQSDEIWLLANRAANAVFEADRMLNGNQEAHNHWVALENEWLRARRTLRIGLTDEKWDQLKAAIYSIRELHLLNADGKNAHFLKLHPAKITDQGGTQGVGGMIDYGTWAIRNGLPEGKAEYDAFLARRAQISEHIEYLLYFNPDLIQQNFPADQAPPLPIELEQAWHFGYLFPRVWRWFVLELFHYLWKDFRDQCRESEEQRRS